MKLKLQIKKSFIALIKMLLKNKKKDGLENEN